MVKVCQAGWDNVHAGRAGERQDRRKRAKSQRVRLMKEDDYRATYSPLISLVGEKCTNDNSVDLALGRPMDEDSVS